METSLLCLLVIVGLLTFPVAKALGAVDLLAVVLAILLPVLVYLVAPRL